MHLGLFSKATMSGVELNLADFWPRRSPAALCPLYITPHQWLALDSAPEKETTAGPFTPADETTEGFQPRSLRVYIPLNGPLGCGFKQPLPRASRGVVIVDVHQRTYMHNAQTPRRRTYVYLEICH